MGLCGGRVVDLSTWLHRSLACLLANLHAKIDLSIGGSIGRLPVWPSSENQMMMDLSTWLHRSLACLLDYLHVKIDLSIGGSIGRLPVWPSAPKFDDSTTLLGQPNQNLTTVQHFWANEAKNDDSIALRGRTRPPPRRQPF